MQVLALNIEIGGAWNRAQTRPAARPRAEPWAQAQAPGAQLGVFLHQFVAGGSGVRNNFLGITEMVVRVVVQEASLA